MMSSLSLLPTHTRIVKVSVCVTVRESVGEVCVGGGDVWVWVWFCGACDAIMMVPPPSRAQRR